MVSLVPCDRVPLPLDWFTSSAVSTSFSIITPRLLSRPARRGGVYEQREAAFTSTESALDQERCCFMTKQAAFWSKKGSDVEQERRCSGRRKPAFLCGLHEKAVFWRRQTVLSRKKNLRLYLRPSPVYVQRRLRTAEEANGRRSRLSAHNQRDEQPCRVLVLLLLFLLSSPVFSSPVFSSPHLPSHLLSLLSSFFSSPVNPSLLLSSAASGRRRGWRTVCARWTRAAGTFLCRRCDTATLPVARPATEGQAIGGRRVMANGRWEMTAGFLWRGRGGGGGGRHGGCGQCATDQQTVGVLWRNALQRQRLSRGRRWKRRAKAGSSPRRRWKHKAKPVAQKVDGGSIEPKRWHAGGLDWGLHHHLFSPRERRASPGHRWCCTQDLVGHRTVSAVIDSMKHVNVL